LFLLLISIFCPLLAIFNEALEELNPMEIQTMIIRLIKIFLFSLSITLFAQASEPDPIALECQKRAIADYSFLPAFTW
jgi:hypothetical protein